jgi:hypothetical protein
MTFLNSIWVWLAAGTLAAAIPILIHLIRWRRPREVRFPSLEFLKDVTQAKVRRFQLRQLLLLILRVLIVALFALAMMRPAMHARGALGRGSTTVGIILDNSFSMSARDPAQSGVPVGGGDRTGDSPVPEEGTVFQTAKRRAAEVVGMMREGDRGVFALAAAPVRIPYATAITDLSLLRQEVERSTIEATRADLPQALERVAGVLAASRTLNREIYVISDFQRIDVEAWQTLLGKRGDSTAVPRGGPRAGARGGTAANVLEGTHVYLIPARTLPVDNLAIERVRLDALAVGPDAAARLVVTIVNDAEDEAKDVVVRALEDGESGEALGEAYVTAPAMGRAEVSLMLRRLPASGSLRVALTPDALPWDNNAYLVTEQPGVRRVLLVCGGDPATDPAARFVRLALDPSGTHEFFQVDVVAPDDPSLTRPLRADLVLVLDVGRFPDAALEQIGRFRSEGGGVLLVLGDRVDPRSYNTTVLPKLAAIELIGLQGDPSRPEVYRSLRVASTGHPIFDGFSGVAGGNLTSARFQRVLEAKPGPGVRVLAEFSGGLPALVEDRGTLVFTTSMDGKWNDLPTSGAFLPLLHRMVLYLCAQGSASDHLKAGDPVERAYAPEEVGGQETAFVDPQGMRTPAVRSALDGRVLLKLPAARLPGTYQLVRADGARLGLFAVSLDARESDLRVAPEGWLPPLFRPAATILKPEGAITRASVEARFGRELWPLLLMIVLGLMVVEGFVARGRVGT